MRVGTHPRSLIALCASAAVLGAATFAIAEAQSAKITDKRPQAGQANPQRGEDKKNDMFPNMSVFDAPKMDKPVGTPSDQPAEPVLTPYKQPKKQ